MANPESFAPFFATPYTRGDGNIEVFAAAFLQAVHQEFNNKRASTQSGVIFEITPRIQYEKNAWSPETGIAWKAAREGRLELAALQLGFTYARLGAEGNVQGIFPKRTRLFFEGYFLEVTGHTELSVTEKEITLHMRDMSCSAHWKKYGPQWMLDTLSSDATFLNWAPVLETDKNRASYVLQPDYPVTSDGYKLPEDTDTLSYASKIATESKDNEIRQSHRYIDTFASSYRNWVNDVSSGFLLCHNPNPASTMSCSSLQLPGLILVGNGTSALQCGELLVHEASHQYLNIYGLLGGLTNNRDQELYYSPLKRSARTIDRVLYAAHATANMLLYYAETLTNGELSAKIQERMAFLLDTFDHTRTPLEKTTGLTASGHAVYETTAAQLDSQDFSWIRNRQPLLA